MRLETIPLILGVLLALLGLALIFDAWAPDNIIVPEERRKRPRRDRDRWGEALVGLGAIAMAATFLGRDTWRYSIVAVIAGVVLLLWGLKRSYGYIKGLFTTGARNKPAADVPPAVRK
jgi:uncharacterized membrane protein HdeD (DUF308 family)